MNPMPLSVTPEKGGLVTITYDPSILDSTDPEVIARCGDRPACAPQVPPRRELEAINLAVEKAGLPKLDPCCARSSRRLYEHLRARC